MEKLDFGKKLIETRKAKGLTQAEVAEMCKIATRTIQRIETGVVKPRAFTIKLISETLGFDYFETSNTGYDVKNENQDSNSENHNFLWYLKDLFNLKTNVMIKSSILTVILILGSFGIISLTNTGAQSVQQSTNSVEKNNNSTSRTELTKKLLVEKINWNSLESYCASQIEFISNEMTIKCTECKYVELKTESGITGLFILGNGIVEVKKGNISDSITGCMLRLNPKYFENMVTIKDKNKTNDKEFVVISKNTLNDSFTHCYHSNMDALIPPVGAYALNFFSKSLGEILASYSDNNTVIYNFTEREFISK